MTTWPAPMPPWMDHAFRHVGLKEIPGKQHNATILLWLRQLKAWWAEDETPWCGTFVAHCLRESGILLPQHWYRAKGYAEYGSAADKNKIPFGAICIKSRTGGGHVFFAAGKSSSGRTIYGIGGNQGNMVNITAFDIDDIDSVRWPPSTLSLARRDLPVIDGQDMAIANRGGTEA